MVVSLVGGGVSFELYGWGLGGVVGGWAKVFFIFSS